MNEASTSKYRLTLIHEEDDWDIPWQHTSVIFSYAVNATLLDRKGLMDAGSESTTELGAGGRVVEWSTDVGVIRKEILNFGLYDEVMSNAIVTVAVMRIFGDTQK